MEEMVKNRLKIWLDEKLEEIDLRDYFGPVYETEVEDFNFSCGDVKMIQQISENVKMTIQKKGYEHFDAKISYHTKSTDCESKNSETELQDRLFNGVSDLLKPYGEDVVSLFTKNMTVVTNENGVIRGGVNCILCNIGNESEKTKRKKRPDSYKQYWNGSNWCLSNFNNHHLRKVHPIQKSASVHVGNEDDSKKKILMKNSPSTSPANEENSNDAGMMRFENYFVMKLYIFTIQFRMQ